MKKYILRYKLVLFFTIIFSALSALATVGVAILLQRSVDIATAGSLEAFKKLVLCLIVYFILMGIIKYIYTILGKILIKKVTYSLRRNIFDRVIDKNISDYMSENSANYISLLTNDIKLIEENYLQSLLIVLQSIITFAGTLILFIILSPLVTLSVVIGMLVLATVPNILGKRLQERQEEYSDQLGVFTAKVKDFMDGFEVIKTYCLEKKSKNQFKDDNKSITGAKFNADKVLALCESVSDVLGTLIMAVVVLVSSYMVLEGKFSVGTLVALIQLSSSLLNPVMMIMQSMPKMQGVAPIVSKIENLGVARSDTFCGTGLPSINNKIKLSDVCFGYTKERTVLQNVNLCFEAGKKYLITGRSGSGKSTLVKLVAGYYPGYSGNILFDDIELHNADIREVSRLLSIIHQDVYLFNASIKENIALEDEVDYSRLEKAIKLSGLKEFVDNFSGGIEGCVGERGALLSGGQRQRIAVARALYQNSKVLVLDEGTSSLDVKTTFDIENSVLKVDKLTVLSISHKLDERILKLYDKIVFIEDGMIKEYGSLDELFELKGLFYEFYNTSK